VTALSLAAQAWPAFNEAPRPVTQPGALIALLWDLFVVPQAAHAGSRLNASYG
jgi:hypothetical protein